MYKDASSKKANITWSESNVCGSSIGESPMATKTPEFAGSITFESED